LAIVQFENALKIIPGHGGAMRAMGWAYLWKNEFNKAKELFEKSLGTEAPEGWAFYGLGMAYDKLNMKKEAVVYYNKAMYLGLGDAQAQESLRQALDALEK